MNINPVEALAWHLVQIDPNIAEKLSTINPLDRQEFLTFIRKTIVTCRVKTILTKEHLSSITSVIIHGTDHEVDTLLLKLLFHIFAFRLEQTRNYLIQPPNTDEEEPQEEGRKPPEPVIST